MWRIVEFLRNLLRPKSKVAFLWRVRGRGLGLEAYGGYLMLLLTNAQKVKLSIQPVDQYGNPARVDGVPTWNNSDETIGTLTAAADGMSADFVTAGPVGTVQVSVTADADLGGGTRSISGTLDIQVEPSEAVSISINAGTPEAR